LDALVSSRDSLRALEKQTNLERKMLDAIYEQEGCHPCEFDRNEVEIDSETRRLYEGTVEALVDYATQQVGGLRYIVKKAYYADRRIELLAHLLRTHPTQIIKTAIREAWLPLGAINEFTQSIVSYSVGVSLGRWDVRMHGRNQEVSGKGEAWD